MRIIAMPARAARCFVGVMYDLAVIARKVNVV